MSRLPDASRCLPAIADFHGFRGTSTCDLIVTSTPGLTLASRAQRQAAVKLLPRHEVLLTGTGTLEKLSAVEDRAAQMHCPDQAQIPGSVALSKAPARPRRSGLPLGATSPVSGDGASHRREACAALSAWLEPLGPPATARFSHTASLKHSSQPFCLYELLASVLAWRTSLWVTPAMLAHPARHLRPACQLEPAGLACWRGCRRPHY